MLWYSADLIERLRLASRHVCGMLDADHGEMPYFYVERRADGTAFAGAFSSPEVDQAQVVGRAMDALFYVEAFTGEAIPAHCEEVYTRYLLGLFENEDALPSVYDPKQDRKRFIDGHSMREDLEGLVWLIERRDSDIAREYAHRMMRTLRRVTDDDFGISPKLVGEAGLGEIFWTISEVQTISSGRLVGPIVKYYRATGDPLALELADIYSHRVMERSFTREGLITDTAWYHIHSIASTLSGVFDFALMTSDEALVDSVRRVYEVGLREFYSSYGWCKELAWLETDQGEVNQTGDLIQVQLMLAANRDPRHYAEAETWMRSFLLPSQVIDNSFVTGSPEPAGDFERDIANRMLGGFGFPTPSAHLQNENSRITTVDITQGAVQAICEFTCHIITKTGLGIQVNLLSSWENDLAKVESRLPVEGDLTITVKHPTNLLVRIPERIVPGSLRVTRAGEDVQIHRRGIYILLPNDQAGAVFHISFTPERFDRPEHVHHKPYTVSWFGEQAIGISPVNGVYPLFGEWVE